MKHNMSTTDNGSQSKLQEEDDEPDDWYVLEIKDRDEWLNESRIRDKRIFSTGCSCKILGEAPASAFDFYSHEASGTDQVE